MQLWHPIYTLEKKTVWISLSLPHLFSMFFRSYLQCAQTTARTLYWNKPLRITSRYLFTHFSLSLSHFICSHITSAIETTLLNNHCHTILLIKSRKSDSTEYLQKARLALSMASQLFNTKIWVLTSISHVEVRGFRAVKMWIMFLRAVTPCSIVPGYESFGLKYLLYLHSRFHLWAIIGIFELLIVLV
jgi:hypothetical protein